jgi:hypothetical protein
MEAPKLELKKNKERLARLQEVKDTATRRTYKRIQLVIDDIAEQKAKKEGQPLEAPKKASK